MRGVQTGYVYEAADSFYVRYWADEILADGKSPYTRGTDLWYLTLADLKTTLFLKAPSALRNGQFSPDGKRVAYASNETGRGEIYVTSFPEARGKPVTTGANFNAGMPIALFQSIPRQPVAITDIFVYDVSRDGLRFLINTPVKQGDTSPMTVVLNWITKLNK
jgi:eukaryotic-like serine/threonine-protein kinase